jgi:hypothetical protein
VPTVTRRYMPLETVTAICEDATIDLAPPSGKLVRPGPRTIGTTP